MRYTISTKILYLIIQIICNINYVYQLIIIINQLYVYCLSIPIIRAMSMKYSREIFILKYFQRETFTILEI